MFTEESNYQITKDVHCIRCLKDTGHYGNCCQNHLYICIQKQNCDNLNRIGRRNCERGIMEKKHPCHAKLCVFRCLISRPKNLNLRSWNQSRGKLTLSRKLRHFMQRELFLNMFYTINLFPLLVIKKGFTLIFILSNYQ